jgi:proteasome lid subunit RPN8/RPN11
MSDVKFNLVCSEDLMKEIENICFTDRQNEVGGFLLGHIDASGSVVTHVIAAKHTQATSTQLTFTPETWNDLYTKQSAIEPKVTLIGWFHSHPNHGVFLSEHDQFIQNNFFKNDGQITIVVDPIRGLRGWFFSSQGKIMKYGRDRETLRPRLGQSATDGDANVGAVMGIKEKSKGGSGKAILWAAIFSLLSFGAGAGYTTLTHQNEQVTIQQLCETVQNLQTKLATFATIGDGNSKVICSLPTKKVATNTTKKGSIKSTPTPTSHTQVPVTTATKKNSAPVVVPSATPSKTKKASGAKKPSKSQVSASPTSTTPGGVVFSNNICTEGEKGTKRPAAKPIQICDGKLWVAIPKPKATATPQATGTSTPPATGTSTPPATGTSTPPAKP